MRAPPASRPGLWLRLEARLLAWALAAAARVVPLPRLLPLLAGRRAGPGLSPAAVERVLAATWRGTCLTRALVRLTLLRRAGVPVRLVIGVGRTGQGRSFAAHAWLLLGDTALGEPAGPPPFRPILSYPDA